MFCISQPMLCQTHYVFNGTGSWSDTGLWAPSYPGLSLGATDTATITSTSILTLLPNIVVQGVFYNQGEMHATDGAYLSVEGLLENNGSYFVDTLGAMTEPSFVALQFVNNGILDILGPTVGEGQPQGMHILDFTNNGIFLGAGWLYISTDSKIVNNGNFDTEILEMESGFFENNDTLQVGIFAYGECPGGTNIFVNYGYADLARGIMLCMQKIENHGEFISSSGNYQSDTIINTNYLEMILAEGSFPVNYTSDVFDNSGYAWLKDGHGLSGFTFKRIVNSDTLIIDSLKIIIDGEIQNSGYFKVINGTISIIGGIENFGGLILDESIITNNKINPALHLSLFNTSNGEIVADTFLGARILNDGKLSIGSPGAKLSTGSQVNSGTIQLKISGNGQSGAGDYQRIQADGDITLLSDNTLEVILDGYIPVPGDSFTVLECSQLLGEFSSILVPEVDECFGWNPTYFPDRLILYITDSPDSDNDGSIDCEDLCPNDSLKIDPGLCGCGNLDLDSDGDGQPDCFETDVTFTRQSNSSLEGVRISGQNADSTQLWYLGSVTDTDTSIMLMNRRSDALQFGTDNTPRMTLDETGKVGIGKAPVQFRLEVNGQASKSSPGDWLANSDARLKRNINPINSSTTFDKLLSLQGMTYEWDDYESYKRPKGIQFGLTAQNIRDVYPELVMQDYDGWLFTSYGTFDPMFIAAFKELKDQIELLQSTIQRLRGRLRSVEQTMALPSAPNTQKK